MWYYRKLGMKYIRLCICIIAISSLVVTSCSSSDYTTDLGDGYLFVSESNANQFITNSDNINGKIDIPCTVESVEYDDLFIIATNRSNPDCFGNDYSEKPISYWIIDKRRKLDLGPLDSLDYIELRNDLKISSDLLLKK
jgi:hypothetical protein